MSTILQVKDLSKQYRLGEIGTGTISHDLNRFFAKIRGKEDPFLMIGEDNDREKNGGDYVWALKNISFKVSKGEVLGIIGNNGAGKSTLLKLLSSITSPTTGEINYNGRIASLLEVGTGFHPELTGKENIFLNGAILGMAKHEIYEKLEEIIDFSGCAKYIDTPVKRYSSGMKVRLGFAVAAHLEPEILIIDEVLAVGDAEFQKKCIGKMQEVAQTGRTVLFVSHNMNSIRNLCNKTLVLEKGKLIFNGFVDDGIEHYLNIHDKSYKEQSKINFKDNGSIAYISSIQTDTDNKYFEFNQKDYTFLISINLKEHISDLILGIIIEDFKGNMLLVSTTDELENDIFKTINKSGEFEISCKVPGMILKPGKYYLTLSLRGMSGKPFHKIDKGLIFHIQDNITFRGLKNRYRNIPIIAPKIGFSLKN